MKTIRENLELLNNKIPSGVKLIAVTKMQPVERIREVYAAGQRRFGENRVKDLITKQPLLPEDIEWHFIGHLQTNKVKFITPFIHTIQSVDSLKLMQEINKHAAKDNRIINCLLQIYIATEETKFGLSKEECLAILNNPELKGLKNICITGLMGMATFTADNQQVEMEFKNLDKLFKEIKVNYQLPDFNVLSMGMSNDYCLAIACGSNMIRVGSKIFEKSKN